jgi:uncharacterized protein
MGTAADSVVSPSEGIAAVRSVNLTGPAGRLEALLNTGAPNAPVSALVCHPHPLFSGTMHNRVVYHAMKVLNDPAWGFALPVLRFNFRGAGLSGGVHDGQAEAADVGAAVDWLVNEYNRPVIVAGFSFGAAMAVRAACGHGATVHALALLGLPVNAGKSYVFPELDTCALPKLFLSGDGDPFASPAKLGQVAEQSAEPRQLALIAGADHFFSGRLQEMQDALAAWLKEQLQ